MGYGRGLLIFSFFRNKNPWIGKKVYICRCKSVRDKWVIYGYVIDLVAVKKKKYENCYYKIGKSRYFGASMIFYQRK